MTVDKNNAHLTLGGGRYLYIVCDIRKLLVP